jgi:hypothetical protein
MTTKTRYPVARNCKFSTREDDRGRLVWRAIEWADAGKFDANDRDEAAVLDALDELEETLAESAEQAGPDNPDACEACHAAEEAVAARLVETRAWFLDAFNGSRLDDPDTVAALERVDWTDYYPVIDGDLRLTGEWVYADQENAEMLSYDNEAMISRDDAEAAGWKIDSDERTAEPTKPVIVEFAVATETIRDRGGIDEFAGLEHPYMTEACEAYRAAAAEALEDDHRARRLVVERPQGQRILHSAWAGTYWKYSSGAIGTMGDLTDDEKAAVSAADDAGREAARKLIEEADAAE